METLTLNSCPQLMETIIAIQLMQDKINNQLLTRNDLTVYSFKDLEKMTGKELFELQEELILIWNEVQPYFTN